MCGIAGRLCYSGIDEKIDIKTVLAICDKMKYRGPNTGGLYYDENIVLGHRRLSIIDLSENAKQPMSTNDGRYHITYNGEIYNFIEIKNELLKFGYHFKSNSDTEVVLNAFVEYGAKCLDKFNGMFAFAIWDKKEKKLFLARDRFGKKPLFYYLNNKCFAFASELTALKEDLQIPFKLSYESLNCFLALGYILNPKTMYEDVFQLEPATYLLFDISGKILEKEKYWNYANAFRKKTTETEKQIAENLLFLLNNAVKQRMISDVPIGAFLSGGIDSSSIVTLMKKYHTGDLHTFSVGFKQDSYNELPDANKMGRWIGTKHHEIIVNAEDNIEILENAINACDQLFADNSIIPMIEVSKLASKYVTVVLSGDGADEMFAGYITYSADKYYEYAKLIPLFLKKLLSVNNFSLSFSKNKINFNYKRKQFFNGTMYDFKKAHYLWRQIFNTEERIQILGENYKDLVYDTDPFYVFKQYYEHVQDLKKLDQHLYVDAMTWLTDDILVKVDRSTMFNSIEARAPYLDVDLVTYAASIPVSIKMKNGRKKYILKKALHNTLPKFVLNKKKSGFNAPINAWIENDCNNEFQSFNKFVYNYKMK